MMHVDATLEDMRDAIKQSEYVNADLSEYVIPLQERLSDCEGWLVRSSSLLQAMNIVLEGVDDPPLVSLPSPGFEDDDVQMADGDHAGKTLLSKERLGLTLLIHFTALSHCRCYHGYGFVSFSQ
jgi:hypothetical protein